LLRQPQQGRRFTRPKEPAQHDESRPVSVISRRHNLFFTTRPPCVKSEINGDRESPGNPNHHRYTVQTMNTRRSFIKTTAGLTLAFGTGISDADTVGTVHEAQKAACLLSGDSGYARLCVSGTWFCAVGVRKDYPCGDCPSDATGRGSEPCALP
jgi:hypothetical protein